MQRISRRKLLQSSLAAYAAQAMPFAAAASGAPAVSGTWKDAAAVASRRKFDRGWKFHLGNNAVPAKDFDYGAMSRESTYAKNGSPLAVCKASFDDSAWAPVDLPHDWAVELPFVEGKFLPEHGGKPLGREYPETSVGWYRRTFTLTQAEQGQRFSLQFDGIFRDALVLLNGMYVGETWSGYAPYSFPVTEMLNFSPPNRDVPNTLVVRVDASLGEGWFYEGAGIYRHVWLTGKQPLYFAEDSAIVRSKLTGASARLDLLCDVVNDSSADQLCRLVASIRGTGSAVAEARSLPVTVRAGERASLTAMASLSKPQLWSPETPEMYEAVFQLHRGDTVTDQESFSFGVRTFRFDAVRGFFVNGVATKIQGTCNHQDHAGVGAALPDALQSYRVKQLKEMGCNAVRTSHNPPADEFLQACDRQGMLAMVETRMMSSSPQGLDQLSRMIRRFRNHPSVFIWSMGNEEREQGSAYGEQMVAAMRKLARRLDPSRPVTLAMNGQWGKGASNSVDVQGCNYNMGQIDAFHAVYPQQPVIGTETGSALGTRGEYVSDKAKGYMSAYDVNFPAWGASAEGWWKICAQREFLGGGFVWTGVDYRGEPTPYSDPCISSHFGIMDTCGFPKDSYYYYKSWWRKEPALHLYPHWNWTERDKSIDVWVQSNLDTVEIFCNGVSLGTKPMSRLGHLQWSVPYAEGYIEARGMRNGQVVLTARRETTGSPSQLRLTADRTQIAADGEDVAVLKVEVLDEQGRVVPTAGNMVEFEIAGSGKIIGVGNGDPSCHEPDKATRRSAFNGLCTAIAQSMTVAGTLRISTRSAGLQDATLEIHTV